MLPGTLQYLQRHQIDTAKWDRCIDHATNGLLYARSFYLDCMTNDWDALVLGDYEAIMPLPWRRKFGIRYLYQPAFIQQLGIFTNGAITEELANTFLRGLPTWFKYAENMFNYAHPANITPSKANYILPLHASYQQLKARYKQDLVKNLKQCRQFGLRYSDEADHNLILTSYKELYGNRMPHVTNEDYDRFQRLCSFLPKENRVVRAVKERDQLLSAALILHDKKRLYLLASVTWPEGRSRKANHFLLDRVINEFASSDLLLDFEGSDLPGIAHFYSNFGGVNQPYFFYRHNWLPWPFRILRPRTNSQTQTPFFQFENRGG